MGRSFLRFLWHLAPGSLRRRVSARLEPARERIDPPQAYNAPTMWPPGHYYSPIPDVDEVRASAERVWGLPPDVPGVDVDAESQLRLIERLAPLCQDVPWREQRQPGLRYYFRNDYFCDGDALVLQSMLRLMRPRRFVEVGSGFSSALVLDTNDRFLGGELDCTFIDRDPVRLRALLTPSDHRRHTVIEQKVQEVDPSIFQSLEAGDFLFIDSSHVSKTGSDVNFLILDVLPTIAPGVLCHVHDIPPRFEYPERWVYEGRAWNEAYLLRAFLAFNRGFRIRLFNGYLRSRLSGEVAALLPGWERDPGCSLWIERTA